MEEPLTKDNPHMDMEYWSHQQVLDFDHHTTAVTTTAEESLIPTLRKEVNSSIVTSAGQTVYLHCLVENLGERSVSEAILVRQFKDHYQFAWEVSSSTQINMQKF